MSNRRRKFDTDRTIEGDALRAALGKNDVRKLVRSQKEPPTKPVPKFHEKPEHPLEKTNPMAERQRKAA
jgi:hypothetical protein